jgi:hypothetical protein
MVDYFHATNPQNAGDVLPSGNGVLIFHQDIVAGIQGAASIGYGVYDLPKATSGGSGAALTGYVPVYWDNTNHIVSPTPGVGNHLGYVVTQTVQDSDTTVRVIHLPQTDPSSKLTDNSGGVVGTTIAADIATQLITISVAALSALANGQTLSIDPGFAGKLLAVNFRVGASPASTAAKAATLTAECNGVNVTGGVVSLTTAACSTAGAQVAGSAITAGNTFTAAQPIGVAVSGVTAFVEGGGQIELSVQNTDLLAAIASMNAAL